jgi:hypothetical protein
MQATRGEEYSPCSFLTSALDGDEWSASRPGSVLPPGKDPWYPLDRRLGGLRAGLDTEGRGKFLCPCRGSNPGRPVQTVVMTDPKYFTSDVVPGTYLSPGHEGVRGCGSIAPVFLDPDTRQIWVVSFTHRPHYAGERAPCTQWIGG